MEKEYRYVVATKCMTYNHAPYIGETLNGFLLQKTDFPVVFIIVDDASNDGEQEMLKSWADDHLKPSDKPLWQALPYGQLAVSTLKDNKNQTFVVLLLSENHFSANKSSLKNRYVEKWLNISKYYAICEGDDYWVDPLKLQKQIDYIDSHTDCSMVCCGTKLYSQREGLFLEDYRCYPTSQNLIVNDVIQRGGGFIPTCSVLYRKDVVENYPEYCKRCKIGDWPLQILAAMKGEIYFFQDIMVVYRTDNPTSWMGRNKNIGFQQRLHRLTPLIDMLEGFAFDYPKFNSVFRTRIFNDVIREVPIRVLHPKDYRLYKKTFESIISDMDENSRIEFCKNSSLLYHIYRKMICRKK